MHSAVACKKVHDSHPGWTCVHHSVCTVDWLGTLNFPYVWEGEWDCKCVPCNGWHPAQSFMPSLNVYSRQTPAKPHNTTGYKAGMIINISIWIIFIPKLCCYLCYSALFWTLQAASNAACLATKSRQEKLATEPEKAECSPYKLVKTT